MWTFETNDRKLKLQPDFGLMSDKFLSRKWVYIWQNRKNKVLPPIETIRGKGLPQQAAVTTQSREAY